MTHDAETAPVTRRTTLLAEDVLLLLFQPSSGTIAGEGTLFYVLAGAVLAELAMTGRIEVEDAGLRGRRVRATGDTPPDDDVLRSAWEAVATKPRGVQTVLAMIGPSLREPLLERLVERGELRRERRRVLGIVPTTALEDGGTGRRAALVEQLRAVLVDGAEPTPRIAAAGALVSASGTLPFFDREIPWTSTVAVRARELEQGDWGAEAAAAAVVRTMTAIVVNAAVVATAAAAAARR